MRPGRLAVIALALAGVAADDAGTAPAPVPAGASTVEALVAALELPASWRSLPALDQAAATALAEPAQARAIERAKLDVAVRGFGDPGSGGFAIVAEARCRAACDGPAALAAVRGALEAAGQDGSLAAAELVVSDTADGAGPGLSAELVMPGAPAEGRAELRGRLRAVIAGAAGGSGGAALPVLRALACFYNVREIEASRAQCEGILAKLEVVP